MISRNAIMLTNYAVRFRYPAELGITEHDTEIAIKNADKVMLFVKQALLTLQK